MESGARTAYPSPQTGYRLTRAVAPFAPDVPRLAPSAARDSEDLIADKQKVTQDLKAAVQAGRTLAINIRAIAKGDVGSRSEKLVEFGVAPLRPRTRKRRPPQGPDEITPAAPSA